MPPPRLRSSCGRATLAMVASKACIAVAIIRARVARRRPNLDMRPVSEPSSAPGPCLPGARGTASGKSRRARTREPSTAVRYALKRQFSRLGAKAPLRLFSCRNRPTHVDDPVPSTVRDLWSAPNRRGANSPGILVISPRPQIFLRAAILIIRRAQLSSVRKSSKTRVIEPPGFGRCSNPIGCGRASRGRPPPRSHPIARPFSIRPCGWLTPAIDDREAPVLRRQRTATRDLVRLCSGGSSDVRRCRALAALPKCGSARLVATPAAMTARRAAAGLDTGEPTMSTMALRKERNC
jgi:hypothetical protein